MQDFLYRFRSLEACLDWKEIENQEIYFASIDQLNDPFEGFKNIFWTGDKIVWKNLFKHYLLCLLHITAMFISGGIEARELKLFTNLANLSIKTSDETL